jgi:hypothetical protein
MQRIFTLIFVGIFTASGCFALQQPSSIQSIPQNQSVTQNDAQSLTITIPAGTTVPVTLTVPIRSRSSHRGDPVRAITASPVTIGTQLAIPAGAYVEGTIEKVRNSGPGGTPILHVHFTRIVFANGYTVSLDAIITQAKADDPDPRFAVASVADEDLSPGATLAFQQLPSQSLPPLPPFPKPHVGLIVGIAAGGVAVAIIGAILFSRRGGGADYTIYDVGSQFDLVFQRAVTLDGARAAAAVNAAQ